VRAPSFVGFFMIFIYDYSAAESGTPVPVKSNPGAC
jgi:hypothetical protein